MKKSIFAVTVICLFICLLIPCTFVGCKPADDETADDSCVSYIQEELYAGCTPNYNVSLSCGRSEEMFIANGIAGELKDFSTLTVTPLHVDLFNCEYTFKLIGASGELTGALTKDTFGTSFTAEVTGLKNIGEVTSITVISSTAEENVVLTDKLLDKINSEEALKIAEENFAEKVAAEKADGKYAREIYVKYINDAENSGSEYYWYVAYIASPSDYWALLIDPVSGDVIVKR